MYQAENYQSIRDPTIGEIWSKNNFLSGNVIISTGWLKSRNVSFSILEILENQGHPWRPLNKWADTSLVQIPLKLVKNGQSGSCGLKSTDFYYYSNGGNHSCLKLEIKIKLVPR